jgi:hypothetical protein
VRPHRNFGRLIVDNLIHYIPEKSIHYYAPTSQEDF